MGYRLDIKDTLKRIAPVGRLIDLIETSTFAMIANALLSMERARLDEAVESTKKHLGDWAGAELDSWWGTILSIERLPGIETAEDYVGDGTYIARIKRFMEAGSKGISLETVRMAAEAGSGVPFRVDKTNNRIILTPLEDISPSGKAGAIRAVNRLAPARAMITIADAESFQANKFLNTWSPWVYIGEDPNRVRLDGPNWNSENMMIVASADKWGTAEEGSLSPGSGLPNLLMRGGAWHVPKMGFGEQTTLIVGTEVDEVINRCQFSIGRGRWRIRGYVEEEMVFQEDIISNRWIQFEKTFDFHNGSSMTFEISNAAQDQEDLFIKGMYVGARVNKNNRVQWLALGGKEGRNAHKEVQIAEAGGIGQGLEWVCEPAPDPSMERELYATIGGAPRVVSSIGMKTRTPGTLFRVSYSLDNVNDDEDFLDLEWIDMPQYYKAKNGRVDIQPFKGRHVKLTFTNLKPMLLREYYSNATQ